MMMKESKVMAADVDIDAIIKAAVLSDLSRELISSLGGSVPETNTRPEKVGGKMIV